jgi:imidazolonepropionase-like amidohydrolase
MSWSNLVRLSACLAWTIGTPLATAATYHFVNGHVIDMAPETRAPHALEIIVTNERIAALGVALEAPPDAIRIDLNGGYLIPGLAEMHAHVPAPGQGDTYRDEVLFLYVANGVTTIRGMLGNPAHLTLRNDLASHAVLGPRLITAGPSFNGASVSSPKQAARMVDAQVAAGYDFLKIHPGLTRAEYDAVAAAARRHGIPFAGHVPADVGLLHALESGQATIDHLDGYVQALVPDLGPDDSGLFAIGLTSRADPGRIDAVVAATVSAGAAVVPTETLLENVSATDRDAVLGRAQNAYLPRELYDGYARRLTDQDGGPDSAAATRFLHLRKRLIKALHDGGALMLLGSDAPQIFNVPGFSAHRELAAMVTAGLSPLEALAMGTRNPATYFGREAELGTLAPGKAADLVWLAANPLDDIANSTSIQGVMVRGRWLDREALDQGLARIATRHARL